MIFTMLLSDSKLFSWTNLPSPMAHNCPGLHPIASRREHAQKELRCLPIGSFRGRLCGIALVTRLCILQTLQNVS